MLPDHQAAERSHSCLWASRRPALGWSARSCVTLRAEEAGAAEPNHREGAAGERAELPECSEPEVPAEPEVQPELRLAAEGEQLAQAAAQEEPSEQPGEAEVHSVSPVQAGRWV